LINIEFIRAIRRIVLSEYLRNVNRPLVLIVVLGVTVAWPDDELLPVYGLGMGITIGVIISAYSLWRFFRSFRSHRQGVAVASDLSTSALLAASLPMMVFTISSFGISHSSLYVLEILQPTDVVGIFSVALKLSVMVSLILTAVNVIAAPKISELYWAGQDLPLRRMLHYSAMGIFFACVGVSTVLLVFRNQILGLFGGEFVYAAKALAILVIGQIVNAFTGSVSIFLNMVGEQRILQLLSVTCLAVTVGLLVLLIPAYGLIGAAVAVAVGTSLLNVSAAVYARLRTGYRTYYFPFLRAPT
jgi:O-antigen/teichoic acid export membrane protein